MGKVRYVSGLLKKPVPGTSTVGESNKATGLSDVRNPRSAVLRKEKLPAHFVYDSLQHHHHSDHLFKRPPTIALRKEYVSGI